MIDKTLLESDYFHDIEQALKTVKNRYNFGEDFEIFTDDIDYISSLDSSLNFSYKSIFLYIRDVEDSWFKFKNRLKDAINRAYELLRPGGILVSSVGYNTKYDIHLQLYTFVISNMFHPLEEFVVFENSGVLYLDVYGKIFYPRNKAKYCFARCFRFQPYNVGTKSVQELDRSFHSTYSAFQNKSVTGWLWNRLSAAEIKEVSLQDNSEDEGLYKICDNWSTKEILHDNEAPSS